MTPAIEGRPDPILIFPSSTMEARRFRALCAAAGRPCIGASAIAGDAAAEGYARWVELPRVFEPDFAARFERAIADLGVTQIFAPNSLVHARLTALIAERGWPLVLLGPEPETARIAVAADLHARADAAPASRMACATARPALTQLERVALLRGAAAVFGQCDDNKIFLLADLARTAPAGDVVEIGSAWGRSAFALFWLARRYGLGAGLSVDPWRTETAHQSEAPDSNQYGIKSDDIFVEYRMHMRMGFEGGINYIRAPSSDALAVYRQSPEITTEDFGVTAYEGRIGLLHIDGNHDFDCVMADLDGWGALVKPGGWIVLDDYVWSFADGPKRAGDRICAARAAEIAQSFVDGVSLCIQFKPGSEGADP